MNKRAFNLGMAFRAGMDYGMKRRIAQDDWVTLQNKEGEYYRVDLPVENPNKIGKKEKADSDGSVRRSFQNTATNHGKDVFNRIKNNPFKPSSTTKQAGEQIKQWFGNKTVVALNPKIPVEHANDIASTLHDVLSEYPEIATQIEAFGSATSVRTAVKKVSLRELSPSEIAKVTEDAKKEFDRKYGSWFNPSDKNTSESLKNDFVARAIEKAKGDVIVKVPSISGRTVACATKDGLYLSSYFSKDGSKDGLDDMKEYEERVGFWVKTDVSGAKTVMLHELGHKLAYYSFGNMDGNEEIREIYQKNGFIKARSELSKYGASSSAEMIAEAFAEYKGSKNPRPMAVRIGKILDDAYKKRVAENAKNP